MTNPARSTEDARLRAEEGTLALSPEGIRRVLHDLRVHQTELELQNLALRRTQELLEASRARYFDLYDLAPIGYFTLSPAGVIQEANLTAAALLGVSRNALVQQSLTRFIAPEDQDIYYQHRKELMETGRRQVWELRLVRGDQERCWVRFEATLGEDSLGDFVCRAVVSDIRTQRRAEETLRASEARHRILFEKSHDALMTLAPPNWRFTSGNSTALTMFGALDMEDFLSRTPSDYSPLRQPDGSVSSDKAAQMIDAALREGSQFFDWTYQRRGGQEFPATVLLTRLEIDGERMLQATIRDETEVKRLQAMLGQADRLASMGILAAGVAHEINNPLAYVLYNIETLATDLPRLAVAVERCVDALRVNLGTPALATVLGGEAALLQPAMLADMVERATDALSGTHRIRTISKAISTFSHMESTKRSRLDVNHAIQSAATMALTTIKFRAKLVVSLGEVPPVWASEGKLSQVFLNLLMNAAQCIDEGNVQGNRVAIRSWVEADDVLVEVEDTGKGISHDALQRIFEPFFTTKSPGVGSGLGLSICRNIVNEFGGDIRVSSEVGTGTRFVVRLPVQTGASGPPPKPSSQIPALPQVRGRILVVDDELAILAMTAQMLGSQHDVVSVASGEGACSLLERDRDFDVILCDLMMPGMTGMELHEWLVTNHRVLAERVVFVTGGAGTLQAAEYIARVGNLRLEKPYDSARLKRLVAERVVLAKHYSSRLGPHPAARRRAST
jgi:two-component system, cell cycle sensor histidine kinase and response regulator CckA